MPPVQLKLNNVGVHYGPIQAVSTLSFDVREGELVTLLGSNGAGKSTTMRAISGLVPLSSGTIFFEGQDISKMKAHKRVKAGIVQAPEGRGIFPGMTVAVALAVGAAVSPPDPVAVEADVVDMIINRVIDNAAVAAASLTRGPVVAARAQALDHPVSRGGHGGTLFGEPNETVSSPEWAAWANGVAVRELDYHDTFLAAEYSHPGDNIPPILAVAQHAGKSGAELIRGVERATTTTVSALRTAIVVAQALANQKLVLDQITALNTTTSNLIVSTSEMLRKQTGEIHTQAASSTVSLDALKQSFANVYATMDAIDTFKVQAVDSMAATVSTLESELGKANSYLSRAREQQERLEGPIGHA